MTSRREFLKEAATGAVLLGSSSTIGLADCAARANHMPARINQKS